MRRRTAAKVIAAVTKGVTEVVGYIRVSTADQAESGLGLEAQRARIGAYALAQGWNLTGVFVDAGVSGKTLDRPDLRKAIAALRPGVVLLALKLDRLTRTARDLDELTALVQARGGEWATVEGNYDTSNAMGRFMLRLVAELAQLEREVTAERTGAALGEKRVRRERLGTTPLGYQTVRSAEGVCSVAVVAEEMETVRMARELRAGGCRFARSPPRSLETAARRSAAGSGSRRRSPSS